MPSPIYALARTARAGVMGALVALPSTTRAQGADTLIPAASLAAIVRADSGWPDAMRRHDADAIVAPYDRDALFITAGGTAIRGRDSVAALYRRRFRSLVRVLDGAITREGVRAASDSLVFEWGHGRLTFADSAGATHTGGGPYLTVWRRASDRSWRIIRNLVF